MTRRTQLIATLVFGVALGASGTAQQRSIDLERSTVTIHVFKSGLLRAFADDHVIRAPLTAGWLDDAESPRVQIVVEACRLHVTDPGMSANDRRDAQTRFLGPEILDANRFPEIRFHSVRIEKLDPSHWDVEGDLELHGQTQPITMKVVLAHGRYKGSATLKQTDFGIKPISLMAGTVRVKNELEIDFDVALD